MPGTAFETHFTSFQMLVRQHFGANRLEGAGPRPALPNLGQALDALQAAADELRRQNEELAATRRYAEALGERYRELFEQAPVAYLVTDAKGTIQEANAAAKAVLAVPGERLVGEPLVLFIANRDRRAFFKLIARPATAARSEMSLVPRSGAPVPVGISVTEVREPGAERRGLRFLLHDLTRIERAAAQLRLSEASFRTMFEHALSAIFVLDDDGCVLEANPSASVLTGYSRTQLVGRQLSELLLESPPAEGEPAGIAKLRRADGALRSLTVTSRKEVAPGRHVLFAMDVTALEAVTADRDLLRALSAHRCAAQDETSRRIARELHDEAGEVLTSVHLSLDQLTAKLPAARRRVRGVRSLLDEVEKRLRRISHELRPILLDDLGLVSALEHLAEGAASRSRIAIEVQDAKIGRLPPAVETALYRIAQEALANALRHARAKRVQIRVWRNEREVTLAVEDDGQGLDLPACATRRSGGLGLASIRERAGSLGGVMTLRSEPLRGLELRVSVPL